MPQLKQTGTSLSEINIVPLVDVVLVLLIIFMITRRNSILQTGIEVDLPQTHTVKGHACNRASSLPSIARN